MEMKPAFAPHKIKSLRPLRDNVLVKDMVFDQRITSSGIIIPNDNGTSLGIRPRWGQVYAVGPEQVDVNTGDWVCIAHGRWTRGIEIEENGVKITLRRVDPKDIFLTSDELPQDDTMSDALHVAHKST